MKQAGYVVVVERMEIHHMQSPICYSLVADCPVVDVVVVVVVVLMEYQVVV